MAGKCWTPLEIARLQQLWASDRTVEEVAHSFPDRTLTSIQVQAKRLHLHHTEEQHKSIQSKKASGVHNGMYGRVGPRRGVPVLESTRRLIGLRAKSRFATGEQKKLFGCANPSYGKPSTMRGKHLSDSAKTTLARKASERWVKRTPEFQRDLLLKMRKGWAQWAGSRNPTWIEKLVSGWLSEMGATFVPQPVAGFYIPDFLLEGKKIVETHGDYWHGNPLKYDPCSLDKTQRANVRRDKAKRTFFENRGYKMLVLWENDLKTNADACKKMLAEFQG